MKMHILSDGLTFALRSEIDTTKTTFIGRVMRRYGIKDMFLPCDLLRDILTEREHLHCSRRLTHFKGAILRQILEEFLKDSSLFCGKAVDKALGKQGRYMRRRLNVATLLVPKTVDRKFVDIELKDIALCWFSPCSMTLLSMNFGSISAPWQRISLTTELSKEIRRLCVSVIVGMIMTRNKNQEGSTTEMDDKLSQIQNQLQKLLEVMTSMTDRTAQINKELRKMKQALGNMTQQEKEVELGRAKAFVAGDCSRDQAHFNATVPEIKHTSMQLRKFKLMVGTPIGEDKSVSVEEETANIEIGMNTEQYDPIDRGIKCTSESKVTDLINIDYRTKLKNYMHNFSTKIIKTVIEFPNEISDEMDNNYDIEEDKEGIGEQWRKVDEEGKRINFSLSSAISLITELDVVTRLQFTYNGKLESMDVLNFMENDGFVAPTLEKVEIDFTWSTVPLGASYKIIQIVDQSILWSFLLAMLALANFEMLEKGGRNIVSSFKEKQCSYHVDYKSKLVQLNHSLKFMNKLCNTINVERHRLSFILRLIVALSVLSIVSFTWFIIHGLGGQIQQQLLMVMKMHSLPDGLTFALHSEIDTTKTTFIGRVMTRRYVIKDMFLPCDLFWDILTGREQLHCIGRLTHFKGSILHQILEKFLKDSNLFCGKAVDKALGKQGRYMRRRLNVAILLVPKTADRKFVDIELKDIALCWFSLCSMTLLSMNFGSINAPWQRISLTTELSKEVRRLCVRRRAYLLMSKKGRRSRRRFGRGDGAGKGDQQGDQVSEKNMVAKLKLEEINFDMMVENDDDCMLWDWCSTEISKFYSLGL
ncbi:hypothetical protein T459_17890 [Capsicum annuum]|uniref:Uncharacterized protein n=1 Tax=Capsicum annuum TaxID=4072 RepID=A0A2G2ZCX6_CAPAN|nr:hypothetical protein T459_17890 [Capsicum annuum]